MKRRQRGILRHYDASWGDLPAGSIQLVDLVGEDSILAQAKMTSKQFALAMERLFALKKISIKTWGPASRPQRWLVAMDVWTEKDD
jgi:hypothetical protein